MNSNRIIEGRNEELFDVNEGRNDDLLMQQRVVDRTKDDDRKSFEEKKLKRIAEENKPDTSDIYSDITGNDLM